MRKIIIALILSVLLSGKSRSAKPADRDKAFTSPGKRDKQ